MFLKERKMNIKLDKLVVEFWVVTQPISTIPGGVGRTPYNGLYREAPPERGTFFRLQVYKRVGISQV